MKFVVSFEGDWNDYRKVISAVDKVIPRWSASEQK